MTLIPNEVEVKDARETHTEMLGRILTPREKQVINLRFGFSTGDTMTLQQAG